MASFGVDDCEQFFGRKSVPSNTTFSQEKMIYVTCLTTLILCNVVYAKEGLSSEVGRTFRLLEKSVSDAVEGGSSDAIGCPFSEVSGVCSGHGNCRDGVCVCEEGYSSFDCSVRGCPQGRSFFFFTLSRRGKYSHKLNIHQDVPDKASVFKVFATALKVMPVSIVAKRRALRLAIIMERAPKASVCLFRALQLYSNANVHVSDSLLSNLERKTPNENKWNTFLSFVIYSNIRYT